MHEKINNLLPDYINNLLPEEQKNLVERHISGCEECAGELDLLKEIRGIEVPEPGQQFWAECPKAAVSAARKRRFQIKYILPPAVAAALLIGFWLHGIFHGGHSQNVAQVNFQDPLSSEFSWGQAVENESTSGIGRDVDAEIGKALASNTQLDTEDSAEGGYAPDLESLGPKELERLGSILDASRSGDRSGRDEPVERSSNQVTERVLG